MGGSLALPSWPSDGVVASSQTEGICKHESRGVGTSLPVYKKPLRGSLDQSLLKRAESIIDGYEPLDPLDATLNMESLQGIVLGLWESAAGSSQYHQDILAALESAVLSIESPDESQLSVFREAIRDLSNNVLTEEHVEIMRQQFIARGFSPLALLDEVEDEGSTENGQDR